VVFAIYIIEGAKGPKVNRHIFQQANSCDLLDVYLSIVFI